MMVGREANFPHAFALRETHRGRGESGRDSYGRSALRGFASADFAGEFGGVRRLHVLPRNESAGCPSVGRDSRRRNDVLDVCRPSPVFVSAALFRRNVERSED